MAASSFTLLVGVLWFTATLVNQPNATGEAAAQADYPNPFSSITREIISQLAAAKQAWEGIGDTATTTSAPAGVQSDLPAPVEASQLSLTAEDIRLAQERLAATSSGWLTPTAGATTTFEEVLVITSSEYARSTTSE